ncbi:aminotransferase class I/II-fold pyridoxal phosphate-dependent enzyme [Massilia niabensis]|uniref:Aminotransferase class I/II-fold pyridoxal phosphate-dependent enzyme n=1 Tax=Massilia niabensis TaxID=544910 RepID=A0ABW0LA01_9BURK
MNEETTVFEGADDIAALLACGALRGSVAGFAQPRGPDLMRRIKPLDDWCALRATYGMWQHARALDGAPGPGACVREEGAAFSTARRGVNFASNDYLSLAAHPAVREAATGALLDAGPHSAGAAGLLGNSRLSLALEAALGALLLLEHVTLFPTGWSAAFGAITALVHGRDYVVIDAQAGVALRQGAAAATRNVVPHRHLDTGHVREILAAIRARDLDNGILVVTEGLFGLDADVPDLPLMQHLCREYGATFLVDVAHDLGATGPGGTGSLGEQAMLGKADIVTGAFSKTFAANGGFVAGNSRALKRQLQLFAGPYQSSSALSPVQAACVLEALRIARSPEGDALRAELLRNALSLRAHLAETGMRCLGAPAPVVPLWIGNEQVARLAGRSLAREGVFVDLAEAGGLASGVLPGAARLRLQVMAEHRPAQLRQGARAIGAAVAGAGAALGVEPAYPPSTPQRRRR